VFQILFVERSVTLALAQAVICAALLVFASPFVSAQNEWRTLQRSWLEEVMPKADLYSDKAGVPPVVRAYRSSEQGDEREFIGYVFTTPDLPPEEVGFSGPIQLLIGMDLQGTITGLKVLYYRESYRTIRGDFIANSGFIDQFPGKSIDDEFRIGRDIDGMSRATISSWAVARGLHRAARRVAEAHLPELTFVVEASQEATALQSLRAQSWRDYIDSGFVTELTASMKTGPDLKLAIAYMGHYRLGELLVGATDYSNADRAASSLVADGHMLLIGLDGNAERLQQNRLGILQNGTLYANQQDRVVFAGTAREGKIAGQAQHAVAMFTDPAVDISRQFQFVYDTGERSGEFTEYVGVDYQLTQDVLTLINGYYTDNSTIDSARLSALLLLALVFLAAVLFRMKKEKEKQSKGRGTGSKRG